MAHGTDWYVSLLTLDVVSADAIKTSTGPIAPDGLNIFPALLANQSSPRTELVHNIDEKSHNAMHVGAIRVGPWKLIKGYPGCTTNGSDTPSNPHGVKGGCYNGVDFAWRPPEMTQPKFDSGKPFTNPPPCSVRPCLFNIKQDPTENHDLADELPAKAQELLERYTQLQQSEVSLEEAQLCLTGAFPDGCRANLNTGVWAPWLH